MTNNQNLVPLTVLKLPDGVEWAGELPAAVTRYLDGAVAEIARLREREAALETMRQRVRRLAIDALTGEQSPYGGLEQILAVSLPAPAPEAQP